MATLDPEEPFFITPAHDKLLRGWKGMPGLFHFYKATAEQLCRAELYSEKSVKLIKMRLCKLVEEGYVQFDARPTAAYRSPYYYVLGNKGVEYLKGLGYNVNPSYRPSKEIGQSYLHLLHQLGVNDILISAALLKTSVAGYSLADFKVERELADKPFNAIWNGKSYGLIPDGFLDFRQALNDGHHLQTPVLYEFDRGTEQEEIIRRKVHAYAAMLGSGWYKTRFGVNSIAVCFITFEGEKRRDKLREWAKEQLHHEDRSLATSFLFATTVQPPVPAHLWLSPCFYTVAMEDEPVTLLGGE
jgi:hypothetical protein